MSRAAAAPGLPSSRPAARRLACALLVAVALLAAAAPLVLAACGGDADPFAGLYWEPSSGRRIEIRHTGDDYVLIYGRDLRPFAATREGDRLVITDPLGGKIIVRPGGTAGTLELVSGGRTTVLKRLPQHQ